MVIGIKLEKDRDWTEMDHYVLGPVFDSVAAACDVVVAVVDWLVAVLSLVEPEPGAGCGVFTIFTITTMNFFSSILYDSIVRSSLRTIPAGKE